MKSLTHNDLKLSPMKPSITQAAEIHPSRAADHRPSITAILVVIFLTIGLTGCRESSFDRADQKRFFYGSIIDQDGRPVSNATITMHSFKAMSDREGIFALPGLKQPRQDDWRKAHIVAIPIIYASAPGYVIDNFAIQRELIDDASARGDRAKPHLVRAWKFADRLPNQRISDVSHIPTESFALDDTKELYVKIKLHESGSDPWLVSAAKDEDWDVAISLAGDAPDAGDAPFTRDWMRKTPPGTAIRVRARVGGVCQADPIFPFSAKGKEFSPVIALKWSGLHRIDDHGWFRIFYRNDSLKYSSFLTIFYRHGSVNQDKQCRLTFASPKHLDVSQVGVLNRSGDDCLEFDPVYSYIMMRLGQASEHYKVYEEDWLPHLRQRDPRLAREIEERLRAQRKDIPP